MKWRLLTVAMLAFVLFPTPAGAVDFSIPDVQIDAQLQQDGTVRVNEKHTYEFDSKFKGIIREIAPKKGSAIERFEAFENGNKLDVEKKKDEYRIQRKGKKGTYVFDLRYEIKDGMTKYEDGAEFYWPFFDKRNETDYGNMTITIMPPDRAHDVLFAGYNSAEEKGSLQDDGSVLFALGEVAEGTNGDIRVVYEPSLFPAMTAVDRKVRPAVRADLQLQEIERAQFAANKEKTNFIGGIVLGVSALSVAMASLFAGLRRKRYIREVKSQIASSGFFVPSYDISLPATILFKKGAATVELMSAALLDLVRKGNVRQIADDEFELIDVNAELDHEQELIKLLFFQVGDDTRFTLSQLKAYTKEEKNYEEWSKSFTMWSQLLLNERKQYDLKESSAGIRSLFSIITLTGITLAIFFGVYELFMLMTFAIVLAVLSLLFAIFYSPRSYAGTLMLQEWQQVEDWMNNMEPNKWDALTTDDRFRVLIYGVGIQHPELEAYYEEFAEAQKQLAAHRSVSGSEYGSDGFYVHNPVFLTGSFNQASSNVSSNAPSSSSSSGGGTGGGGGGSGAF
ncbi:MULTISPECIES: DUF2207 domain-containing protein [unclassified Sporosarcina]|uniref:DUF2207 domain-containing protein n=1 Tax=unclassified Sporosarcina TaxID=2647733 RepID=UPI0020401C15|nr:MULTISPECIES: DUF2207 domain-containing protein [unclassified Sporosarcina]GKV64414.1 hypothetical protein NCCP2331_05670 [Sporosarcina sp. NCCP-2331]GLB55159.1 hypothetical protein NCCP2378_09450 [Sporosarcina sp. NCCP-2378]